MIRSIPSNPSNHEFYLVDANFLANKFIPYDRVKDSREKVRVIHSHDWWAFIDKQLNAGKATVYIPDLCIAEAFKVLAKKYYNEKYFRNSQEYKFSRDQLRNFVSMNQRQLRAQSRIVKVHDISTCRDIIIAVDRFYEIFCKYKLTASIVDLIVLATAKYLIDFYYIQPNCLHIVTLDKSLWQGSRHLADIPRAYNPNEKTEFANRIFQ
jgi:hypothetical protein